MLRLTNAAGEQLPISSYEEFKIKHVMDGCDTMSFILDTRDPRYPDVHEECRVETADNLWLVKKIDDDEISCELDFDFLKARIYLQYRSETRSLTEVLEDHLPAGWTVEGANVSTIRRTISLDAATDFDVIYACQNTYKVYFRWKLKEHRLIVYDPTKMGSTGEYLTSELNLKALSFKGDSTAFCTRLYCLGADGLTIEKAQVDDGNGGTRDYGLTYVENRGYADKVVCAYWVDNRYKHADSMYLDALDKIATMSVPTRTYKCQVDDLAKKDPRYHFLDFAMHKKISLIDVDRRITVEHQIVEYVEHPDNPDENTVTLSCVPETIQLKMQTIINATKEETEKEAASLGDRITMATALLTGAFGGYITSVDGELFIMDSPDPATAEVVWRWNINGFGKSSTGIDGPYTTSMTFDDTFITNLIEAMVIRGSLIEADSIQAGSINQSYTDGVLEQSYKAAEGLVEYMAKQLNDYLTNEDGTGRLDVLQETITQIQQTVDGLKLSFTDAYKGGINYLANSSGLNSVSDDWVYVGTVETAQNDDTKNSTVANSCFVLHGGSILSQTVDNVVVGSNYAISVKAKQTTDEACTLRVVYNGDSEMMVFEVREISGWTEYHAVIENVQAPTVTVEMEAKGDRLYVADLMLCEGSNPKGWTPAPNEIYTSGTTIDKRGIQVFRAGSSEWTAITNREFAGYYRDEKIFTVNKDETRMKKTTVDGEFTVGDCKFIPYKTDAAEGLNIALID